MNGRENVTWVNDKNQSDEWLSDLLTTKKALSIADTLLLILDTSCGKKSKWKYFQCKWALTKTYESSFLYLGS